MLRELEALPILGDLDTTSIVVGELIGYVGITIIVFGAAKGLYLFVEQFFKGENFLADIRIELGQHLALGLEFLVGKDIIESLVEPTWDDLGKLGVLIVLRTVLTIFLGREIKEVEREAREERREQERHRRKLKLLRVKKGTGA